MRALSEQTNGTEFETWLQTTRGMVSGFSSNGGLADDPEELTCRDVQAPIFSCASEPCEVIELEAASVQALVLKLDGENRSIIQSPNSSAQSRGTCEERMDFVHEIIERENAVQRYCGEGFRHCLKAIDVVWDAEPVDYQASIQLTSVLPRALEPGGVELDVDGTQDSAWFCGQVRRRVFHELFQKKTLPLCGLHLMHTLHLFHVA